MKVSKILCRNPQRLSVQKISLEEYFALREMKKIIIHSYLK